MQIRLHVFRFKGNNVACHGRNRLHKRDPGGRRGLIIFIHELNAYMQCFAATATKCKLVAFFLYFFRVK